MNPRVWDAYLTDADRHHELAPAGPRAESALARRIVALHLEDPGMPAPAEVRDRIVHLLASLRARSVPVHEVVAAASDAGASSAFFGTPLLPLLVRDGAETLVLCGGAASGRLRATAVEAASSGFAVVVVEDCVWDPIEASRAIALYDIHRLYGTVVTSADLGSGPPAPEPHGHHTPEPHGHHPPEPHGHHAHGPDGPPPMTALPPSVLAALPDGAVPVSTAHHPIHGHVLSRAGDSILAAVTDTMTSSFGSTPHVVVVLRSEDVTDQPDLRRALEQTSGGVLVVGVGYRAPSASAAAAPAPPAPKAIATAAPPVPGPAEPCPECGRPAARTERAPADHSGRQVLLYVCDECGAAWDV
ncbi:MAG: hypothetical protein QOE97_2252 [Pseudonocardiales bacterium]|nr:hypothetical protein [Pseudonocardiales bacterium]